ncbi:MAG: protein kinase [Gammaproteobacteria bacterium]|nr:protein kinase [Gammaproteobacteria bacterium]
MSAPTPVDFRSALETYIAGHLSISQLEAALVNALRAEPHMEAAHHGLVAAYGRVGRLPADAVEHLSGVFAAQAWKAAPAGSTPPPPPQAPADNDRTAFRGAPSTPRVPPPPAPPAPPAAPQPPAVDNDRTAFRGAPSMPRTPTTPAAPTGPNMAGYTGSAQPPYAQTGSVTGGFTSGQTTGGNMTGSVTGSVTGATGATGTGGTSSWADIQRTGGGSPMGGAPLVVGSVLKERFVLESILGRGGMGTVFKARDLRKEEAMDRNPHVAIKVLNEDFKQHPEALKALQRESRKSQELAHPNILSVFDFDRDGANVYVVMELLDGESLEKVIKRHENVGLEHKEAFRIIRDLGRGLSYAHQRNIIHSDFKPSNCFTTKAGAIKVFDFGIARAAKHTGPTTDTQQTVFDAGSLGALTFAYATPEMFDGKDPDQRDDLYALGIVAYELLTGRHPYNRKSAPEARDLKMKPKPVPGLTRRQTRALERALAFTRDERQKDVDTFVDELMPKALNKTVIGISAGAAVLIAAVAAPQLWSMWNDRRINAVAQDIKRGDPAIIDARMKEFDSYSPEEQQKLLASKEVSDALSKYFEERIVALIDTTKPDFDFTAAAALATMALKVNPDSARYNELKARVEEGRNQAINAFNAAIDDQLQKGVLVSADGRGGVAGALEKLRRVNPEHPRLKDAQIVDAFAAKASAALERGDVGATNALIDAGLKYATAGSAARTALDNLRDQLKSRQSELETASQVAKIEEQLRPLLTDSATLESFAQERDRILTLRSAKPDSPILPQGQQRLASLVQKRVADLGAARSFADAQQVLDQFADLLPRDFVAAQRSQVEQAQAAYTERVGSTLNALAKAVQAGNLEGAGPGTAASLLVALEKAGGTPAQVASSRDLIAQGYVAKSQQARNRRAFDEARKMVDAGAALKPSAKVLDLLQDERGQITATERGMVQQERTAEIQQLRGGLDKVLAASQITISDAEAALQAIVKLEGRGVRDAALGGARNKLIAKLTSEAARLDASGATTEAAAFAESARALFPDSAVLQKSAASLKQKASSAQAAASRNQQLAAARADLDKSLAAARFDDAWDKQLQLGVARLKALVPAGDPQVLAASEKVARVYLARAGALRQAEKFVEAEKMIEKARGYSPAMPGLDAEAKQIATQKQAFAAKAEAERSAGAVALLKQRVLDKARGNEVVEARKLLAEFTAKYGNDPKYSGFITSEGPLAIGQALERSAARFAAAGDFRQAITYAQQASEAAPKGDKNTAEAVRLFGQLSSFSQTLDQGIRWQPDRVRPLLASLESRYPAAFGGIRTKLQERAQAGISRRPAAEQEALRRLVQETFNPEAARETARPAPVKPATPAPSAPVVAPPPTGPATGAGPSVPSQTVPAPGTPAGGAPPAAGPGVVAGGAPATGVAPSPTTGGTGGTTRTGGCQVERAGAGTRSLCSDAWTGGKGPSLMVIPAGGGSGRPFAMTRYEVRIDDVRAFCAEAGGCPALGADGKLPVSTFGVKDAERFAEWLRGKTGESYRLPTDAEWTHAAKATGDGTDDDAWCIVRVGGVTKGEVVASAQNGKPNAWGLSNMMGNVQEWARSGGSWVAKGGSFNDRLADCRADTTKPHSGQADGATGFRLVREIR